MVKIEEGKELIMENVISYRGVMTQCEMQERMQEIDQLIKRNNLTINGKAITTTFSISESGKFDMQILVPVNMQLELPASYTFKKDFKLFDAVYARHTGSPTELSKTYEIMNQYILDNRMVSITSGYNILINEAKPSNIEEIAIDVYIGVSRNVL